MFVKVLRLSLNERQLIAKSKGIKGYKTMSEDDRSKKRNKKIEDKDLMENEDYDSDKIQQMLIQQK